MSYFDNLDNGYLKNIKKIDKIEKKVYRYVLLHLY
jgi:hypothetical protein